MRFFNPIRKYRGFKREKKFKALLKSYNVNKCYISNYFSFDDKLPEGEILVDVNDVHLIMSIYKLCTKDPDGILEEGQVLFVCYDDFKMHEPNYDLPLTKREKKFRELLRKNGVTKCYVEDVYFDSIYTRGRILVDNPDKAFILELYNLFSVDGKGTFEDDQLFVYIRYDTFEEYEPNYDF